MDGLEQALWRAVISGPFRYGHLTLTIAHVEKLRALSNACGGWITFDDTFEESFVPLEQWAEQYPSE
jgi:hypothetical protein